MSCNAVLDSIDMFNLFKSIKQPKVLIKTENTASNAWTRKYATGSIIGKNLNTMFCSLSCDQLVGIDSEYYESNLNECADNVSRLTNNFDLLTSLFQKCPVLDTYSWHQLPQDLLSLLCKGLLSKLEGARIPLRLKGHFIPNSSALLNG